MNLHLLRLLFVFSFLAGASACVHQIPPPSKKDFSDQVLAGLAETNSEEIINQLKAERTALFQEQLQQLHQTQNQNQKKKKFLGGLLSFGAVALGVPKAAAIGPLGTTPDPEKENIEEKALRAKHDQDLALLDSKRIPLRKELLDLYMNQAQPIKNGFSVCMEGIERRYALVKENFTRIEDGNGPCEKIPHTDLNTLKGPPSK